jgi:anti-sigma-K factor RskA
MMNFHKKIVPYLDGSLSQEELSEFEAFVRTHPDFELEIKEKEEQLAVLRKLIPEAAISKDSTLSLEAEVKASVFNLLKQERQTFWGAMKDRFEEWASR